VAFRNYAVLRNIARAAYYADYRSFTPPDYVPARFTSWVAGAIALAVMWVRFGMQSWDLVVLPGG
jgi:hypothetical protein